MSVHVQIPWQILDEPQVIASFLQSVAPSIDVGLRVSSTLPGKRNSDSTIAIDLRRSSLADEILRKLLWLEAYVVEPGSPLLR